jgi:hypothetical protein
MSDSGAIGVITSLEASFLETHLGLWHCRFAVGHGWILPVARQGGLVQVAGLKGFADLTWRRLKLC